MSDAIGKRIVFLDYMRVFAFVSVLVGHKFFTELTALASSPDEHITIRLIAQVLMPLCYGGAAGVIVFFLTSGYIITHVLQKEGATDFLIKRIFRIYPLYIFAVIMEMIFDSAFNGVPALPLSVIIPRILLIGDFFNTPYALAGVEWTLRIEVMFYAFMYLAKAFGLFRKQSILPYVYAVTALVIFAAPKFPNGLGWSDGYFNLYAPFLLCGSCIYLSHKKISSMASSVSSIGFMLALFLFLIPEYQPAWGESNYAVFAIGIFFIALILRDSLQDSKALILLSELTYSVYLFHNWLWNYIYDTFFKNNWYLFDLRLQTLIVLLVFCYVTNKTIEQFGIKAGRLVLGAIRRRNQLAPRLI